MEKDLMEKMDGVLALEGEIVGDFSFELLEPRDNAVIDSAPIDADICTSTSTSCDCTSTSSSCC